MMSLFVSNCLAVSQAEYGGHPFRQFLCSPILPLEYPRKIQVMTGMSYLFISDVELEVFYRSLAKTPL